MFQATSLNERNDQVQRRYRLMFLAMTLLLVLPVLIILTLLVVRGAPAISMEFLLAYPKSGMTAGGIFPALL
ncbi:MAG: phosphate ABC transporter, permease protein PstA, partial [Rhodothermales bacterium]|nr:phosphate ABC transporter, permease protein PstA [Rhodothermales bacterium]